MYTVKPAGDGLTLYVVTVVMMVLGWTTVLTRVTVRRMIKQFGTDDILMVAGLVLFTVTCGLVIAFIYYGGGYHSAELKPQTIALGTKYYFVAQVFYCAATIPIKCSICVALIRIAGARVVYRYILFFIIGLSITSGLATAIGIMNVCRPISALWGETEGSCDPTINSKVAYFFSAMCIITDWTLAILPARILWNVQLKQRIRISVAVLLALGAFASCATVIRLRFLVLYNDPNEFLYGSARIAVWSILELGIGVFAGSMAHLRPLLRFIPCMSKSSYAAESHDLHTAPRLHRRGGTGNETFRNHRTVVEGGKERSTGKRDVDLIYKDVKGDQDGDSQKHILEEGGGGRRDEENSNSGKGIKTVTEVRVTGEDRNSNEASYEPASPLPLSEPALGRSAWRDE